MSVFRTQALSSTAADELASLHGKMLVNQFAVRNFLSSGDCLAIFQSDRFLRRFEMFLSQLENLPAGIASG